MARKRKPVATGVLCAHPVEVYLRDGGGGNYDQLDGQPCRIYVGCSNKEFDDHGLTILLHEAWEFVSATYGLRYDRWPARSFDSGDCSFVMNHTEFSAVAMQVAQFLAVAMPVFEKAWRKMAHAAKT